MYNFRYFVISDSYSLFCWKHRQMTAIAINHTRTNEHVKASNTKIKINKNVTTLKCEITNDFVVFFIVILIH